jgi:site-specific DNA recombinase
MAPRPPARRRTALGPLTVFIRPQRVAAYGRVSTDVQREAESIKVQVLKLESTIRIRENAELPDKDQLQLIDSCWDEGISGTIPLEHRPEGRRLVALICSYGTTDCDGNCMGSQIDQVWITKLDRLARSLQILINIASFLTAHRVALVCMDPGMDTSTESGRLVFNVIASIAQWERGTILERTVAGKHQKASEGKFVGGRKAYGLVTDSNGHLALDTTYDENLKMMRYEVVQSVFENIALHGSTAWREAQRIGVTDRRLNWMLHNVRYKGEGGILDKNGEWTNAASNPPPQVVTPEVWDAAQAALANNKKNSSRNRHYDYLLSHVLICHEPNGEGICGRVFTGRTEARHKYQANYTYYYCSRTMKQAHSPSQAGCTAKMLRAGDAEDAVWAEVKAVVRDPHAYLAMLDDGRSEQLRIQLDAELQQIAAQIQRAKTEHENVLRSGELGLRDYASTAVRVKEVIDQTNALYERQEVIELQLRSIGMDRVAAERSAITVADIAEKLDEIEAADDRKRKAALIRAVVKSAEVRTVNGRPTIRLELRLGAAIDLGSTVPHIGSIDSRSGQESSDNPQLQSQAPSKTARVGATYAEDNPQVEQEEFVIVREISLPARRGSAA